MATELEDLEVTSVDFVDKGANPNAHIRLFKRDAGEPAGEPAAELQHKDSVWKRFINAVGKAVGLKQEDIDETVQEIEKCAGEDLTKQDGQSGGGGQTDPEDGEEDDQDEGQEGQQEGNQEPQRKNVGKKATKGENEPMIDTSKMTPSEKLFYDDIVKRYSMDGNEPAGGDPQGGNAGDGNVAKGAAGAAGAEGNTPAGDQGGEADDIYKGLHPAVAAELKALRKRAEDEDERAIKEVAKKYEIIGKKADELAPVLKSLKAAGGTAYDDMISVLDASVAAVKKSGLFEEIGKSGSYGTGSEGEAWSKIEKKADEIQTANPKIERHQAIDMACMQNPNLVHDYENGR